MTVPSVPVLFGSFHLLAALVFALGALQGFMHPLQIALRAHAFRKDGQENAIVNGFNLRAKAP